MTDAASTAENRTLAQTPRRLPNAAYRPREYLTETEVDRLIEAARKRGRNGARDACAILLAYRHGLRASELCQLRWAQIDLRHGRLHVNRAKLRVRHRSRDTGHPALVPADGPANWRGRQATIPSASAYAPACDRV
jgi:integrase